MATRHVTGFLVAFDAVAVHEARRERGCTRIVPMNQERVLATEKPRPTVRSLVSGFRRDRSPIPQLPQLRLAQAVVMGQLVQDGDADFLA